MTTRDFVFAFWTISHQTNLIGERFHNIRQLYEICEIQNKVLDETASQVVDIIEFRYVLCSFVPSFFR